jgi:putative transposase
MQRELPDRRTRTTCNDLATAILEWLEGFYNPTRRNSALGYHSPADHEKLHPTALTQAA